MGYSKNFYILYNNLKTDNETNKIKKDPEIDISVVSPTQAANKKRV